MEYPLVRRGRNRFGWGSQTGRYITGPNYFIEAEVISARSVPIPRSGRQVAADALRAVRSAGSRAGGAVWNVLGKAGGRGVGALAGVARAVAPAAKATAIVGGAIGGGVAMVGAGLVMGAPLGLLEARRAGGQWKSAEESAYMSSLIANAQVGPFGTGNRPYGMGSNYGNAAGMTLALHYARNGTGIKDPSMQMMGGLAGGRIGRFVGSF